MHTVLVDQFQRIRDGDRFWYQNIFQGRQLDELERTTLADVIERNTGIDNLQGNVFVDMPGSNLKEQPARNHRHRMRLLPPPAGVQHHHRPMAPAPAVQQEMPVAEPSLRVGPPTSDNTANQARDLGRVKQVPDKLEDQFDTNVPDTGLEANELAAIDLVMSRMRFGRHR